MSLESLTHLRLQKLLYYVQGWHLAAFGRPLFDDRFRAWRLGPVTEGVYQELKRFGCCGLSPDDLGPPETLTPEQEAFVTGVWERYKDHSASALVRLTHAEPPWRDARSNVAADEMSGAEITQDALRDFFGSRLRELGADPAEVARAYEGLAAFAAGRLRTHVEVFGARR
jgi:uncharacterized phage-associated protein